MKKVGEVAVGRRLVSFHVRYVDVVTGQRQHSKLHLADLASSERLQPSEAGGERLTESLHITKALSWSASSSTLNPEP